MSIHDAGGTAIVQPPDEAYASAMPEAALKLCPDARIISLADIPAYLESIAR